MELWTNKINAAIQLFAALKTEEHSLLTALRIAEQGENYSLHTKARARWFAAREQAQSANAQVVLLIEERLYQDRLRQNTHTVSGRC